MNDDRRIMEGVRDLLSDESRWCKEAFARNAVGVATDPLGGGACSWCIAGAYKKIVDDFNVTLMDRHKINHAIKEFLGHKAAISFNDKASHYELMNLLNYVVEKVSE